MPGEQADGWGGGGKIESFPCRRDIIPRRRRGGSSCRGARVVRWGSGDAGWRLLRADDLDESPQGKAGGDDPRTGAQLLPLRLGGTKATADELELPAFQGRTTREHSAAQKLNEDLDDERSFQVGLENKNNPATPFSEKNGRRIDVVGFRLRRALLGRIRSGTSTDSA